MLICVFVKISTNPSPKVRSFPWRLHESEIQVQGNQRFFFSSRDFAALPSGEKSRKTSGTRVEMSTISVFFSALIPKGLFVQVAVQKSLICDFSVMLLYFSVPQWRNGFQLVQNFLQFERITSVIFKSHPLFFPMRRTSVLLWCTHKP